MGLFTEQCNYLVLGKKGSGKSALSWKVAETIQQVQGKAVYVYRYPRPELLKKIPFEVENIVNFSHLFNLTNAVLLFDEAHKWFSVLQKKIDERLKNLLGDSRQNDIDCVFCCHNSYFINRSLFTFIDVKMIKEVNEGHWELERPHMKKLYENFPVHGPENYFIDCDWERGKTSFEKPPWYTDEFSNAFRVSDKPVDLFSTTLRQHARTRPKMPAHAKRLK